MKKLNKIKLNNLSAENISGKQLKEIKGGEDGWCTCSCYWENNGGSSTNDNCVANFRLGDGYSTEGPNQARCIEVTN